MDCEKRMEEKGSSKCRPTWPTGKAVGIRKFANIISFCMLLVLLSGVVLSEPKQGNDVDKRNTDMVEVEGVEYEEKELMIRTVDKEREEVAVPDVLHLQHPQDEKKTRVERSSGVAEEEAKAEAEGEEQRQGQRQQEESPRSKRRSERKKEQGTSRIAEKNKKGVMGSGGEDGGAEEGVAERAAEEEEYESEAEHETEWGPRRGPIEGVSECYSCSRDKIRLRSLETIKDSILSKLGMTHPPNVTERPKPKIADQLLMMLLRKKHSQHGSNGLYWVTQDDDLEEMQGDEPYDSRSSDEARGRSSHFSHRSSSLLRSHANTSDRYSDPTDFKEGETYTDEEDDYHVKTERIVTFSQPHPRIRHLPHIQYFEFSDRLRSSKVKRALLWMYIKGRESTGVVGNKITISIYKVLDPGKPGSSGSRESPVITSVKVDSTQSIPNGSGAWIMMDYIQIKNLVADWFRNPQNNFGIVISAEDANGTNLAVTSHADTGEDTANIPFLEVYVTENRKHRTKRTVGLNCKPSSKETRCCRYPLTVDFVEFGWDWVIAPKKYDAFYCAGECPLAFLTQYPHTHIFHLAMREGNGPCCAPKKFSELEMLYFDQDMNIIFGKIPAMRVERCGCTVGAGAGKERWCRSLLSFGCGRRPCIRFLDEGTNCRIQSQEIWLCGMFSNSIKSYI